jgi:acyl transferase domain-containing protein
MEQDPVVIIGMAARFPQDATSTSNLWQFLLAGRSAHSAIPTDRIGPGYYHPDPEHGGTVRTHGIGNIITYTNSLTVRR